MKTLSTSFQAKLQRGVVTFATCWRVTLKNGTSIYGTEHDRELTVSSGDQAGVYSPSNSITASSIQGKADGSPDTTQAEGYIQTSFGVRAIDIESGLYDDASFTLFLVDYEDPDDFQLILRTGSIGQIKRTTDGNYFAELRGLTQRLAQTLLRTFSTRCDAQLFDSRCTVSSANYQMAGTVVGVVSRRRIIVDVSSSPTALLLDQYAGGQVTFTSGDLEGISREVKASSVDSSQLLDVEFFEALPASPTVGDSVTGLPGCDRTIRTCKLTFDNILNFRGHAVYAPTLKSVISGPLESGSVEDLMAAWSALTAELFS